MNVENFKEMYEHFGVWGLIIITLVSLLPILLHPQKLKGFIDTISYARRMGIRDKEIALQSPHTEPFTRRSIQRKIDEDYFYQNNGFRVDFYLGRAVSALCEYSRGGITMYTVRRAVGYLSYNGSQLKVSLTSFDRGFAKVFFMLFILSIISAVILSSLIAILIIELDVTEIMKNNILGLIAISILCIIILLYGSFMFLTTYFQITSAVKIEEYLIENSNFNNAHLIEKPIFDLIDYKDNQRAIENNQQIVENNQEN